MIKNIEGISGGLAKRPDNVFYTIFRWCDRKWNCKLTFLRQAMCGRQGGSEETPKLRQNHQSIKTSSTSWLLPQNTLQHKSIKTQYITINQISSYSHCFGSSHSRHRWKSLVLLSSKDVTKQDWTHKKVPRYQFHTTQSTAMIWWSKRKVKRKFDSVQEILPDAQRESEQHSDRALFFLEDLGGHRYT